MSTQLTLTQQVESRIKAFASVLPPTIKPARFVAAAKTALVQVPGLRDCTAQSIVLALMKCAGDGLVPDGRDAVMVVVNAKRKDGTWEKKASYWAMVQGQLKVLYRTGLVTRVEPRLVHEKDKFALTFGSETHVDHTPELRDPGEPLGCYVVFHMKSGGQYVEWMTRDEIDAIAARSKSRDKEGNPSGPWASDWGEMAKKTVIKRGLKFLPVELPMAAEEDDDEDAAWSDVNTELLGEPDEPPKEPFKTRHAVPGGEVTSGLGNGKPAPEAESSDPSRRYWTQELKQFSDAIGKARDRVEAADIYHEAIAAYDDMPEEAMQAFIQVFEKKLELLPQQG